MNRRSFFSMAAGGVAGVAFRGRSASYQQQAATNLVQIALEAKAGVVPFAGRSAYLYSYNNQVPGPLIQARPGDTLRVGFTNNLPEATNLHFHGLHVSPSGAADNSFVMVAPGEQFHYELSIPTNHPAGTFWMHPHMHGSVARQVWRGLAAPVIIRGELDAIPTIQAAREVVLVLQDITLSADGKPIEPTLMQKIAGREGSLIAASGALNPSISIQENGWIDRKSVV